MERTYQLFVENEVSEIGVWCIILLVFLLLIECLPKIQKDAGVFCSAIILILLSSFGIVGAIPVCLV